MTPYIAGAHSAVKPPVSILVDALGGDASSGMCCCPAHADERPSLHVQEVNGKTLFHCFAGCEQAAVLDALRDRGLWPIPGSPVSSNQGTTRSKEERRAFALRMLRDTEDNRGRALAPLMLGEYFAGRGIERVPDTALIHVGWGIDIAYPRWIPRNRAMLFAVTDLREIIGCHVTWLSDDLLTKRDPALGPQRQSFGPIAGGFIKLYSGELDPVAKLVIAEGVETACAASQISGDLPAIVALSANNLAKIIPPCAAEYIVAADNDPPGLHGARALAVRLVRAGHKVRLAVPPRANTDWNDVLIERQVQNG